MAYRRQEAQRPSEEVSDVGATIRLVLSSTDKRAMLASFQETLTLSSAVNDTARRAT